jgi:hypothetical protein
MLGLYLSLKSYHSRKPSFKTAGDERGDTGRGRGVTASLLHLLSLCGCMEEKFRAKGRESRI